MKIFGFTLRGRRMLSWLHDTLAAGVAFALAMLLRYGDELFLRTDDTWLLSCYLFVAVAGGIFAFSGLTRGVWRYASLSDLRRIMVFATLVLLAFYPLAFGVTRLEGVPRSVPIMAWILLIGFMGGSRLLVRMLREGRGASLLNQQARTKLPVLLLGAGDEAEAFIRISTQDRQSPYRIVGVLDAKGRRVGRQIRGIDVLGSTDDLASIMARLRDTDNAPARLILTRAPAQLGLDADALLETANKLGLNLARLPALTAIAEGTAHSPDLRAVAVEDLINRPEVKLDRDSMAALVRGQRVLVTGAGGTIGSELCRQIGALAPVRLVLFEQSEFALYQIDIALREAFPQLSIRAVLGDVGDSLQLRHVFADEQPGIIFHAAAYKHVPLGEANVRATVATNVLGTLAVAEAAADIRAKAMVMISTDKAVNPTNVMGASKRVAELICQARDGEGAHTRFVTVRFGNVIGSTGSVVPRFQEQLQRGGPLTVTHPDIKRYFMTVREAVELVLQASSYALSGRDDAARGQILVLDMGEPLRIIDLARQMIRLAGLKPDVDVKVEITGLRPGEKLKEELFRPAERLQPAAVDGIHLALAAPVRFADIEPALLALIDAVQQDSAPDVIRAALQRLVAEYDFGHRAG